MLAANDYTNLISQRRKLFGERPGILLGSTCVRHHHHIKISLDDGLSNIQDVYIVICQVRADLCDDAYGVVSYHCDDCLFHCLVPFYTVITSDMQSLFATWILKSRDL